MALSNPYCSVAQVQTEIRNTDATLVSQLEEAINQASRYVDEWTGRDWFQHNYTVTPLYVRGEMGMIDGNVLWLPYWPVITLTAVTEYGATLTQDTDFVAVDERLIRVGTDWMCGLVNADSIALTGKFGYAQASSTAIPTGIPEHVTRATIMVAAAFSGKDMKEIVSADGVRDTVISKTIAKDVEKILGPRAGRVGA